MKESPLAGGAAAGGHDGKFRDECLNEHWFISLPDARRLIADWRCDHNECRPHGALACKTPEEFADAWAAAPFPPGEEPDQGNQTVDNQPDQAIMLPTGLSWQMVQSAGEGQRRLVVCREFQPRNPPVSRSPRARPFF